MNWIKGVVAGLLVVAAACSDDVSVASVVILPQSLIMQTGESCALTARAEDAGGNTVTGPDASWVSSSPSVASVSRNGRVSAVGIGSAIVTATAHGRAGTLSVAVIARIFRSAARAPTPSLVIGVPAQMMLKLFDVDDAPIIATVPTAWAINDTTIATVSATGLVTPKKQGTAIASASFATGCSIAAQYAATAIFVVPAPSTF